MADLSGTIKQLIAQRDLLNAAIVALESVNGTFRMGRRSKRTISAAARARIVAAQRKRWAAWRKDKKAA